MTSEGVFDFLRGGKPISIELSQSETKEKESSESIEQFKAELWTLYTLNPESKNCPLDCIIIHVRA